MTEPTPPDQPPSVVLDDRLCERCGFNLNGRTIERESRYGLLITRCPQCRQVAALDEHPRLGPWIGRWAMLGAALWLLMLVALSLGALGGATGMTIGFTYESTERLERRLGRMQQEWFAGQYPQLPSGSARDEGYFAEYWSQRGARELQEHPEWLREDLEKDELAVLLVPAGIALIVGSLWSIVLLPSRRRPMILIAIGLGALYVLVIGLIWLRLAALEIDSPEHAAWLIMRMPILMIALPTLAGLFIAGLFVGRAVARGLVRALLPPRFRGVLSLLWTADGRPVPWPGPGQDAGRGAKR